MYLVIVHHRCFPWLDVSNHISCKEVHNLAMCGVRHLVEGLGDAMINHCCVRWCRFRKQMRCIEDKVQPKVVFRVRWLPMCGMQLQS